MFNDTIIAQSSPPTRGGTRAIIRLSGPDAWPLARAVASFNRDYGHQPVTFQLPTDLSFRGSILLFKSPKSFTGEDIAELHIPNSPPLIRALTDAILSAAAHQHRTARIAEPGEFSSRAFFNGKIDLTEAEGIAATIQATQTTQLRAAAALREGLLHREIAAITDRVANLLALLEAGIDFADEEDIHFIDAARLESELKAAADALRDRLDKSLHMEHAGTMPTVVFVGKPNVGKSYLINALAGTERSIVSPVAGTTRDILSAVMHTQRGNVRLLDVPGEEPRTDELRQKMMEARSRALLSADLIVEVFDASTTNPADLESAEYPCGVQRVLNKADLIPEIPVTGLTVSAKTGAGIEALRNKIAVAVQMQIMLGSEQIALNQRHRARMLDARLCLNRALSLVTAHNITRHAELIAAELRAALDHLGQITGTISPDEVLGRIFSQFCIGK